MEATRGIVELVKSNWNSEEKPKYLKRKLNELVAIKKDLNSELERAESLFNKKRKNEVANWLEEVERVEHEFQNFEAEMREARWGKLWGGGPVQSLSEVVCELIGRRSRFQGGLVLDVGETTAEPFLLTNLVGEAFQVNLEKIWAWLLKGEVSTIGIYGMGGVGKTNLVTHIHNRILQSPDPFSNVYWITLSQDFSIHKLQSQIAKVIGLDLSNETDEKKRAAKLYKAMEMRQRSVLFLDDLWNQFSPDEVGIPIHPTVCQLILTTRSLEICRMMSCHKKMKLEPLLDEESWSLFVEKLGNYATLPLEVKQVAKSVAKECAGLPLGIVTLARSLKGVDDVREWRSVLEKLKQSTAALGEMDDKVFQVLNFSYIRLKDPALQACFLCCALFPKDYEIKREDLIDYMIGEGIIKGLNSIHAEFDRGHALLNKLENACLLDGPRGFVKMHDLLRDMAFNVMKENAKAIVQAGKHLTELPKEIEWSRDLVRVSLMKNYIEEIPLGFSPECPNLSTLLLCYNSSLESIADSFFIQLCGLKVLDLSYTGIAVLPNSVSNLVCLTSLLLKHCRKLWYMPSLIMLKALKKLDIYGTKVEVMPQGLEFIMDLRYLDMGGTKIMDMPIGFLSKLSHLQYLRLRMSRPEFFGDFCRGLQMMNPDKRQLLSRYDLLIGQCDNVRGAQNAHVNDLDKISNRVVFSRFDIGEEGQFVVIPKDLRRLGIFQCDATRSLCNVVIVEGTTKLEHLEISGCDSLDCLMSVHCSSPNIFDCIKTLKLRSLRTLRVLFNWEGAPPISRWNGVFSCLTHFEMHLCPIIKSLFSCELLSNLKNLQEIVVVNCQRMEEIIALHGRDKTAPPPFLLGGAFPHLKHLVIRECPSMKVLFPYDLSLHFQNLEEIVVQDCQRMEEILGLDSREEAAPPPFPLSGAFPCLKRLVIRACPSMKAPFLHDYFQLCQNLEKIVVDPSWRMEVRDLDDGEEAAPLPFLLGGAFSRLKRLVIRALPSMKVLFPFDLLHVFQNLAEIVVDDCQRMEKILTLDSGEEAAPPQLLLGGAFPCLKRIFIRLCPSMKVLFPYDLLHLFQNLEEIEVVECSGMEEIIAKNGKEGAAAPLSSLAGAFSCLKCFSVRDCLRVKYLFPYDLLINLRNLEKVRVTNCWNMEEMIVLEAREEGEEIMEEGSNSRSYGNCSVITTAECSFPKLSLFELRNTPKLRRIFDGKMICHSIEQIVVWNCPRLQRIPISLIQLDNEQQPFPLPTLKCISIKSEEWWNSVEWDHPNAKEVLQPLLTLQRLNPPPLAIIRSPRIYSTTENGEQMVTWKQR